MAFKFNWSLREHDNKGLCTKSKNLREVSERPSSYSHAYRSLLSSFQFVLLQQFHQGQFYLQQSKSHTDTVVWTKSKWHKSIGMTLGFLFFRKPVGSNNFFIYVQATLPSSHLCHLCELCSYQPRETVVFSTFCR